MCQDKYISLNDPKRHTPASTWAKRVVYQFYIRMKSVWKKRCDLVHVADGKAISKREKKTLRKEIKLQFRLGPDGVRANDKDLLYRSKSTVLSYSIKNKKYWVQTLKASRTFVDDFETNMFSGMRGIMRQWAAVPI